ncbi:MAG: nuclear transport factor 2 family protein [Deltaproteobacteria bacterium]|nr:nuclear transport factor 2 family protein [Deltaproteobacteria bacterium]
MSEEVTFDPDRSWASLEERIGRESDPRCRQLLEQVRDHLRTEIGGDLPALMATLVDEPGYHLWGLPIEAGPKGRAAVEEFYSQMIANGGHRFELDFRRIVVDHDAVVTEGVMYQRLPGSALTVSGIAEVDGEPVDPDASYRAETQILTVWPMSAEGRIEGEDIYLGSPPLGKLTKLGDA